MNSNTTEEQIKHKIDSLDTLQAGIVFGREDAWDKLQARLDAKPIRKTFPIFRLAAVAALVLGLITIAIMYMYMQPKQNSTSPDVMVRLSNHDISVGQDAPISSPSPLERVGVRPDSFHSQNFISSASVKPHHLKPSAPHYESPQSPDPQPIAQASQPSPTVVSTPAVAAKPVMKVVHINELGKEQAPVYEFADKDIPHPHVMFKMKVIHINNLMKPINQDDYLREMQNNTAVHFPLFRRPADRQPNDQPRTLFKINLSN